MSLYWTIRRALRRLRLCRVIEGYRYPEESAGRRLSRALTLAWALVPHGRWVADGRMCGADGARTLSWTETLRAMWSADSVTWQGASVGTMLRSVATLQVAGRRDAVVLYADARHDNGHWPTRRVRRAVMS